MEWLTNEVLFYGGIAVAACSFLFAIVYFIVSHIRRIHLDSQLDREYGKKEANKTGAFMQ